MHEGMQYDPSKVKVTRSWHFQKLSPPPCTMRAGKVATGHWFLN